MEKKENYLICTRIGDTFPKNKEIIMHFVSESALNKYPKNSDKQEFYINNSEWVDKNITTTYIRFDYDYNNCDVLKKWKK